MSLDLFHATDLMSICSYTLSQHGQLPVIIFPLVSELVQ